MTSLKRQYGYLNQQVILFRLKYETHSIQIHPKFLCRSVVALMPKLSEQQYALRLVVVPCQHLPNPSIFFQPVSPSPSSHISYVAVLHLLHHSINSCCPAYLPPYLSAAVFTSDLFYHPHYPGATILPQVSSHYLSIFAQSVAVLSTHFSISVVPQLICCRPTSPTPPYPFLLSRISTTMLVRCCLHRQPCMPYLLSCISDSPPLLSPHVSVALLIALSAIILCTSPPLFDHLL